jgi:hypothetical protein
MHTYFRNPKHEVLTLKEGEVVECDLCGDKLTKVFERQTCEVVSQKSNGETVQVGTDVLVCCTHDCQALGLIDENFKGEAVDPLAWID